MILCNRSVTNIGNHSVSQKKKFGQLAQRKNGQKINFLAVVQLGKVMILIFDYILFIILWHFSASSRWCRRVCSVLSAKPRMSASEPFFDSFSKALITFLWSEII